MTKISVFHWKDIDIEVTYRNRKLAYAFKFEDKNYGKSISLKNRTIQSTIDATWQLLQNAEETITLIKK